MQRQLAAWALVCGALAWTTPAQAQIGMYAPPQINPRPTISPYLNILRGNPAINYFGTVRPQIEMNRQLFHLQQEVQQLQPGVVMPLDQSALGPNGIATGLTTGHPASFQNYSHYYGNRLGTSGVAGGTGNPIGYPNLGAAPIRPVLAGAAVIP